MQGRKILIYVFILLICTGTILAYTATLEDSGTGDPSSLEETECTDAPKDNDGDGDVDEQDSGCTKPYYEDDSEANIWDTDLTSVMMGDGNVPLSGSVSELEQDKSVFYDGAVYIGSDATPDNLGSGSLAEKHIDGVYDESQWGGGQKESVSYSKSDFPTGTVFQNNRPIDPPNDLEGACGDGIEGTGVYKSGDVGDATGTTYCVPDFGRVNQKHYVKSPYQRDDLDCEQDYVTCEVLTESCETDDPYCGSSSCNSCPANDGSATATCDTECTWKNEDSSNNNEDDESNTYYLTSGDVITTHSCEKDGYPVDSAECDQTGSNKCETSGDTSCSYDSGPNCRDSSSCTANSDSDTAYDYSEKGYYREMKQVDSYNCNTQHSRTDGGGENSGDDVSTNKADNDPAGTYTRFTAHNDDTWDTSNGAGVNQDGETQDGTVWCGYDYTLTVDADGPKGYGDGFVVISHGSITATESPDGSDSVGTVHYGQDGSVDSTSRYLNRVDTSCPDGKNTCLKYVDFMTVAGSGDSGNPDWKKVDDAVKIDQGESETYTADESYSVCKNINRINQKNGDGTELIDCDIEDDTGGGGGGNDPPSGYGACGDEADEYWAYMEGHEINEDLMSEYPGHYQACVDKISDCVLKGKEVSEGHVANVAPVYSNAQYEKGGNSPDWEVCLNIDQGNPGGTGDDMEGDNMDYDRDGSEEELGGEWYDLDSEVAQEYLRGSGSHLVSSISSGQTKDNSVDDSNNDGTSNESDIDYYWRQNPNPSDPTYNPEGESEGTALEDDCGNERFASDDIKGCTDAKEKHSSGDLRQPTFYSFMTEGQRDEDYHPWGDDVSVSNSVFTGYINKLSDMSNQLESGMDTSNYYTSTSPDPDIWSNSDGSQDAADQWGYSQNLKWSISSRGVPYPPWSTYYRDATNQRTDSDSSSAQKKNKVFGNSYAAVADATMQDDNGNSVDPGDGVWIDPDYIRTAWNSGNFQWDTSYTTWQDPVTFKMDITGPDSGIGFDTGDGSGVSFKGTSGNQKAVVYGDIYFQGEEDNIDNDGDSGADESPSQENWEGTNEVGETVTEIEPPLCGDDQKEYLLEEKGESKRSAQFDGMYACANTSNPCVDMSSTPRIVAKGEYNQANEPDENVGRLKNDLEICEQRPQDDTSNWYDQDFGDITGNGEQDTCRTNDLYDDRGVRWIDADYVQNYPHAVTGGIDDDWNQYIENNYNTGNSDEYPEQYTSKPNKDSWNFGSESPVPSGSRAVGNDSIATLGFCGGDDEGEYLVTQQCQTGLCETNRDIQGVTKTPGGCVFEPSTLSSGYSTDLDERKIFEPGDEIDVNLGSQTRTIACFNSNWYEDWPIVFNQNTVEVPFGGSTTTSFQIINVREERTTFEVEMIDPLTDNPSAYQHSTFLEQSGDSFETTVAPGSSETFYVNIEGANKAIGDDSEPSEDDLTIRANAVNSEMTGQDNTTVEVVDNTATNSNVGKSDPQSVPGIGPVHIIALIMMSTAVFFLQS